MYFMAFCQIYDLMGLFIFVCHAILGYRFISVVSICHPCFIVNLIVSNYL